MNVKYDCERVMAGISLVANISVFRSVKMLGSSSQIRLQKLEMGAARFIFGISPITTRLPCRSTWCCRHACWWRKCSSCSWPFPRFAIFKSQIRFFQKINNAYVLLDATGRFAILAEVGSLAGPGPHPDWTLSLGDLGLGLGGLGGGQGDGSLSKSYS